MDYQGMAASALRMIAKAGRVISIKRFSGGVYDPTTDTFTGDLQQTVSAKAVFTKFSMDEIDGELIRRDDKRVLIAAASIGFAPATTDKIIDGAVEYSVVNTEAVQPGDVLLLFKVQVRR